MIRGVLIASGLIGLAACGQERGYPPNYEFNFMQACEAQRPAAGVCSCIWDRIEAGVRRSDFEALERMSASERAESPVTAQIEGFALACAPAPAPLSEPPPP